MTRLLPLSNHSLLPAGYLSGAAAVFAILSDQKNKTHFGCSAHWKAVSKGESLAAYDIWTHSLPTAGLIQWRCVLATSQNVSLCGPDLILRQTVRDGCWSLELQEGYRKNDTAATVSHFVDAGWSYFTLWNSEVVTWVGKCRENWISPQQWCLLWEMIHSRKYYSDPGCFWFRFIVYWARGSVVQDLTVFLIYVTFRRLDLMTLTLLIIMKMTFYDVDFEFYMLRWWTWHKIIIDATLFLDVISGSGSSLYWSIS